MTHEELEAIRLRACGPPEDRGYDVPYLLDYIDELHGVVHDLRQEPGWELGRQEERREVLELLENELDILEDEDAHAEAEAVEIAARKVRSRGPVALHLAPDDLRRENEALRAALRETLRYFDPTRVFPFDGQRYGDMIEQAHRLLGDDV